MNKKLFPATSSKLKRDDFLRASEEVGKIKLLYQLQCRYAFMSLLIGHSTNNNNRPIRQRYLPKTGSSKVTLKHSSPKVVIRSPGSKSNFIPLYRDI